MTEQEELKLLRFSKQMAIEQDNNAHKGSILEWKGIHDKLSDLEYHKAKMQIAIRKENKEAIKEFIADCGNILLAIGNEFGLYDEPNTDNEKTHILKENVFKNASIEESKEARKKHKKKQKSWNSWSS